MKRLPLDFERMLKDINEIVDNDWGFEIDCKLNMDRGRGSKWTQEEADKMAKALTTIYSISHGWYCEACGGKYRAKPYKEIDKDNSEVVERVFKKDDLI